MRRTLHERNFSWRSYNCMVRSFFPLSFSNLTHYLEMLLRQGYMLWNSAAMPSYAKQKQFLWIKSSRAFLFLQHCNLSMAFVCHVSHLNKEYWEKNCCMYHQEASSIM